jgi:hypothetical protein
MKQLLADLPAEREKKVQQGRWQQQLLATPGGSTVAEGRAVGQQAAPWAVPLAAAGTRYPRWRERKGRRRKKRWRGRTDAWGLPKMKRRARGG